MFFSGRLRFGILKWRSKINLYESLEPRGPTKFLLAIFGLPTILIKNIILIMI
jgi:hypothetical protein